MCASRRAAREEGIRERLENDDRQEWSLIGKIHRDSRPITRRWKAIFRDCYCRDVMILIMLAASWCRRTPQCGCRIKISIL